MSTAEKKVAIVTGAARGIGKAITLALAEDSYAVVINFHRSHEEASAVCQQITDMGGAALAYQADVTVRSEVEEMLAETLKAFGRVDVLVNNAGILEQKPFIEISDTDWDETMDANLKSAFLCTQIFGKRMQPKGSIVNICSIGGQIGGPKAPHYAASKGALSTFTKSSARLFAPNNIRVNAVSPGFIDTEMFDHILQAQNEKRAEIEKTIPLQRIGSPSDIAEAVSFLVSEKAKYITGHVLNVNGGTLI